MLEIASLSKKFGRPLFDQASMRLERGTGAVLSGPNGSGKSTLIRMIAGLLLPDSGTIRLGGLPASGQRGRLGICPSTSAGFYRRLSVRQNLHHFGSLYGLLPNEVDTYLARQELFEIDYWDEPAERLSDGMLQKVKITRTFMHDPELALLDEPLNYLDAASKQVFLDWLVAWLGDAPRGRGYVFAQHASDIPGVTWAIRGCRLEREPG